MKQGSEINQSNCKNIYLLFKLKLQACPFLIPSHCVHVQDHVEQNLLIFFSKEANKTC